MQVSKIKSIIVVLVLLTVALSQTLSIGGVIRNDTGASVADGAVAMDFRLYTVESGGTAVWNESQSINVVNGVYSHLLGSVNSLAGLNFNVSYWLGISIEGAAELSPRTKLTLSPYAIMAGMSGTTNVFPQDGRVGIGTTDPTAGKLFISASGDATQNEWGPDHSVYMRDSDHALYMGADTETRSGYLQSTDIGTAHSNLALNPLGGNVGIGTTSPQTKLEVNGDIATVAQPNRYFHSSGFISNQIGQNSDFRDIDAGYYVVGGGLQFVAGGNTDALRIQSGGNVGIGTSVPVGALHIHKPGAASIFLEDPEGANYIIADNNKLFIGRSLSTTPGNDMLVVDNASGNIGIGTGSPQAKLDVNGDVAIHGNLRVYGNVDIMNPYTGIRWGGQDGNSIKQEDNGSFIQFWSNSSSMIFYYNGNTFAHWSDRRLKRNFSNLNGALAQLSQLKPFSFDYQTDMMPKGLLPGGTHYGVDAGEVQKLFPHLVKEVSHPQNSEEKYLTVNYTEFVPILIQAVNDQENEMAALKAQQQETVDKLIKRIEALEKRAGI